MRKLDLTGKVFGKLIVVKYVYSKKGNTFWLCKCDCGEYTISKGVDLNRNRIKSCGCSHGEKHRLSDIQLYKVWANMKSRCYSKNNDVNKYYGERGITVCDDWRNSFVKFYNWAINNGYNESLTLDRIDVNGNYEPKNCRWVSWNTQFNNRRSNHNIEFNGQTHNIIEWAKILGIKYKKLAHRIERKWDIEKALTTP